MSFNSKPQGQKILLPSNISRRQLLQYSGIVLGASLMPNILHNSTSQPALQQNGVTSVNRQHTYIFGMGVTCPGFRHNPSIVVEVTVSP